MLRAVDVRQSVIAYSFVVRDRDTSVLFSGRCRCLEYKHDDLPLFNLKTGDLILSARVILKRIKLVGGTLAAS